MEAYALDLLFGWTGACRLGLDLADRASRFSRRFGGGWAVWSCRRWLCCSPCVTLRKPLDRWFCLYWVA